MSHCCVSSSPGCFVPVPVFLCGNPDQATWTAATFWIPACVGMTDKTPSPGGAFGTAGLSTAGGEAIYFIRLKCYVIFANRRDSQNRLFSATLGVSWCYEHQ